MLKKLSGFVILIFIVTGTWAVIAAPMNVPRISKEELKSMLGKPDLVVIDVRTSFDLKLSPKQIKGAVREDSDSAKVESWSKKYSKDKTLVLYCS